MQFIKQIRDPVHGWIRLTKDEVELLDSLPVIQRLRYIKQLGMVYLVYPSAVYSRFDHSLGVMHLAYHIGKELLPKVAVSEDLDYLLKHLRLAALLHDIGHYPFSHTFEGVIGELVSASKDLGCGNSVDISLFEREKPHEVTGRLIVERISSDLRERGYDPSLIKSILDKEYSSKDGEIVKILSGIVSGTLDADRLDYIMRDLYFTGAAVGTSIGHIDLERMISNIDYVKGYGLVFDEKARVHLEGYVITRYNIYRHVYLHHKTILFTEVARSILRENIQKCREGSLKGVICEYLCDLARFVSGDISEDILWRTTDDFFVSVFINDTKFKDLLSRRKLGYISLWKRDKDYLEIFKDDVKLINRTIDEIYSSSEIEAQQIMKTVLIEELNRMLEKTGCKLADGDLEIAHAAFDPKADDIYIATQEGPIRLEQLSPLVQAVKEAWDRSPHFFAYLREEAARSCGNRVVAYIKRILPAVLPYVAKVSLIAPE